MSRRGLAARQVRTLFQAGAVATGSDGQLLDRFLLGADHGGEEAFEVLVRRHGPMVLGACRWVLRDVQEAEDAYQATFLILARKAGSIRDRESVGPWLRGVARRVANRARLDAARRQEGRLRLAEIRPAWASADPSASEERALLLEEVGRLPAPYRDPVALCYFEAMPYEAACQALRLTEATLRGRLARARALLRSRLARRGVGPAALLGPLPPKIADPTPLARAAVELAAGRTGVASASVLTLMEGASRTMTLARWKIAASIAGLFGLGLAGLGPGAPSTPQAAPARAVPPAAGAEAPKLDPDLARVVPGRVLRAAPVARDNMVLAYLPDWAFGGVDNIGVANNNGGVRTLLDWPEVPADEAPRPDRRFLLAVYARKATEGGKAGPILAFEVLEGWREQTSWKTLPEYQPEPAATFPFEPGEGWKLLDVTPIVRARAKAGQAGNGILLRFLSEDRGEGRRGWSGYELVSREGKDKWAERRPVLLVVVPGDK